ncbi:MAG: formylglycine-generating enzyme family protein, partial [Pirellula sp.]
SSTIAGLVEGMTYYVRAYATNNLGTGYGNQVNFVFTPSPAGMNTLLGGTFSMGCTPGDVNCSYLELPVRPVTLSTFQISETEVTQAQWQAVMGQNPSVFSDDQNQPVEMVSWEDAQEFLRCLNALHLGGEFRLPTEAEWEYAARAGSTTRFGFGDDPDYRLLAQHAWFYSRAEGQSHSVGLKIPNAWGLYDMHGNVWEWCSDWFAPFADDQPVTDPQGPETGAHRVIRGGSWFNEPEALRSANRHRHSPDSRQTNIGLRLIWVLP